MRLKTLFSVVIILSFNYLYSQWTIIPGTENKGLSQLKVYADQLFVTDQSVTDSTFISINLSDYTKRLMLDHNGNFFPYAGHHYRTVSSNTMLYSINNSVYKSTDTGISWQLVNNNLPSGGVPYLYSKDSLFFIGASSYLLASFDTASSFSSIFYENFYVNANINPLILIDSILIVSQERGLMGFNVFNNNYTTYNNTPYFLKSITSFNDTLIGCSFDKIYHSYDSGVNWIHIGNSPFSVSSMQEILYSDGVTYVYDYNEGVYASVDNGNTFYEIHLGINNNASTKYKDVEIDSTHVYMSTNMGVFKRLKSTVKKHVLTGYVFYDINSNGLKDSNESIIPNQTLKLKRKGKFFTTDSSGCFYVDYIGLPDTIEYISNQSFYNPTYSTAYSQNYIDSFNFPIEIDSTIKSLDVFISPLTNSRPGFNTSFLIDIRNHGAVNVSDSLTIILDPVLILQNASDPNYTTLGNEIYWQNNIKKFEHKQIILDCSIPANINYLGDTLKIIGRISPLVNDYYPSDNIDTMKQIITGSYDPNDKSVFPLGDVTDSFVASNNWLNYLIRFQNTGTDTAFNILITDTLSSHLNTNSFELINSSHNCNVEIDSLNISRFHFENIKLPDSNVNFDNSNGFIRYRIKPNVSFSHGDSIKNTAYIFFDFNPPIITNTTLTVIKNQTATSIIVDGSEYELSMNAYPNPTKDYINYYYDEDINDVKVFDLTGKEINTHKRRISNSIIQIDFSDFNNGVYFIRSIFTKDQIKIEKVLKF